MARKIKLLAFDPGLSITGWGVMSFDRNNSNMMALETGTLKPVNQAKRVHNKELVNKYGSRIVTLDVLKFQLDELFLRVKPDYVTVEDIFVNPKTRYVSAYIALSQWMATVEMYMYSQAMKTYKIPTRIAKQCVASNGGADKSNIQTALFNISNLTFKKRIKSISSDEADALAVGYTFGQLTLPELLNN